MDGLTKEDVLTLRLEIAELRREIADLRREIAARDISVAMPGVSSPMIEQGEAVSTEQIMTEWIEGEDAWKAKETK